MEKTKFCPALWFSGFFGLGAIAHLVRYVLGFQVIIAGHEIPLNVSAVIASVAGILSIALAVLAMKRPCDRSGGEKKGNDSHSTGGCCRH